MRAVTLQLVSGAGAHQAPVRRPDLLRLVPVGALLNGVRRIRFRAAQLDDYLRSEPILQAHPECEMENAMQIRM